MAGELSRGEQPQQRLARLLCRQADHCAELGSPLYADLLTRAAADALADGPVARALAGHEQDSHASVLPLRFLGGVHALALSGEAPELAAHYPSAGGSYDDADATWAAFRTVVSERAADLRPWLDLAPQTNEVGRAAGLAGGLRHVAAEHRMPVRLLEMGASAGLNLRADHYRYLPADGPAWGPAESPVVLADAWRGASLPDAEVEIVQRLGCDVSPIDPCTDEGRLRLLAYVWPDQQERIARLRGALEVAARVPAQVVKATAQEFVESLQLVEGTVTVLWHSVMWQYLDHAEQKAVGHRLAELAAQATHDAALAHLALEPRRQTPGGEHEFFVTLESWPPTGPPGERVLGAAAPHGPPVTWRRPDAAVITARD